MRWSLNLLLLPFWFSSRPCLSWKTFGNIVRIIIVPNLVKQIPKKNASFIRNYNGFKDSKWGNTLTLSCLLWSQYLLKWTFQVSYLLFNRKLFPCSLERIFNVEECWNEWFVFRNNEHVPELKFSFLWQKSLFLVEFWNNWVIRDSSLHFPAFWGTPAVSGLQDGALEQDLEQPGWAEEWETPNSPPRMRFPKEFALYRLQRLASRGERPLEDWSIGWKTPQNSSHFQVKITQILGNCAPIKRTGKISTVASKVKSGN